MAEREGDHEGVRRVAGGVASWTLLGFVLGSVGPGIAVLTLAGPGAWLAIFVVTSTLVGLGGGVVLGVLDPPGRLVSVNHRGGALVVRTALSGLAGLVLGAVWTGLAGAVAGSVLVLIPALLQPTPAGGLAASPVDMVGGIAVLGGALGVLTGTPGVVLFSVLRAVAINRAWPWWAPAVGVAVAAILTGALSVPVFTSLFGAW